jgi:hypothetical protein
MVIRNTFSDIRTGFIALMESWPSAIGPVGTSLSDRMISSGAP